MNIFKHIILWTYEDISPDYVPRGIMGRNSRVGLYLVLLKTPKEFSKAVVLFWTPINNA